MKSLTLDLDYIDNFVTFVLCWKDSSTLKKQLQNKQFKQGFAGRTCFCVPSVHALPQQMNLQQHLTVLQRLLVFVEE